jgi:CDGSH-type Zn-finger protein
MDFQVSASNSFTFQNILQQNLTFNNDDAKDVKGKEFLNQKNKRRSKKDKTGRNFICGCGKEYLSYPALYTHIKTKHDGKNPEGTVANQATKTKRGRPKKVLPSQFSYH